MKASHGDDGGVGKGLRNGHRSCWLNIVNEARIIKEQGVDFFEFLRLQL